jgi:tRNA (guanine37-N1)-methyltransferase
MMRINILTLFPEMCNSVINESIIGRAIKKGIISVNSINIRDYTEDKHNRVDDYPYGGGRGMVMQAEPIYNCFNELCKKADCRPHLIYMSPQGIPLTQKKAIELSKMQDIAILCGHYEGVDERIIEDIVDEQISIGDYVLTGGELPALVLTDVVCRLIPGVLSDEECLTEESHFDGVLEYPQYTRPSVWNGREVPEVLLSGHAANIVKWRRKKSLERTKQIRPDLFNKLELSEKDKKLIGQEDS